MKTPRPLFDENQRLQVLAEYRLLDSSPEPSFDQLTALAAEFFCAPVSLISLVDADRIWFKSHHGLATDQTERSSGFCATAMEADDLYVVENAEKDERTRDHPFVTGALGLRFYAGAPLKCPDGIPLGTFSVIDFKPRTLTAQESFYLRTMATVVMDKLEAHRSMLKTLSENDMLVKTVSQIPGAIHQFKMTPEGKTFFPFFRNGSKKIFHLSPEELGQSAQRTIQTIVPEDRADFLAMLEKSARDLTPTRHEFRVKYGDGTERTLQTHSYPERLPDNSVLWHGYTADITEAKEAEEKAQETDRFFKSITEHMPGLVSYWTMEQTCTFANRIYKEWYGWSAQEMMQGMTLEQFLGAETYEARLPYIQGVMAGQPQIFDVEIHLHQGKKSNILVQYIPDVKQGRQEGFFVYVSDLTEIKKTERALNSTRRQFENSFAYAAIGMALVTMDGWPFRVNRALCEMLGYTEQELLTKNLDDLTHPHDMAICRKQLNQLLQGTVQHCRLEKRFFHKNGEEVWGLFSVSLVRDAKGEPLHYIKQIQDITAEREAVRALRRSEERWKFALEGNGDGLWDLDVATDIVMLSESWKERLGVKLEKTTQTRADYFKLIHPEDLETCVQALESCIRGEQPSFQIEFRLRQANGTWIWVLARGLVVHRDAQNNPDRMVGSISNITERKLLEDQLRQAQKMEVVGRLAGGVAHDFNNILTAMLLNLEELAAQEELSPGAQSPLLQTISLAKQGASFIQQLLMFSRQQPLKTTHLQVNETVQNLLHMLKRLIGDNIDLCFAPCAEDGGIEADSGMMTQALLNLCVNARDAMPQGGRLLLSTHLVELTESTLPSPHARPGRFVQINIQDTGIGMNAETLQHVFEPFFTTKEVGKGTGLGLASTYGIIAQHRGWIEVESIKNVGSTFRLYLPLATGTFIPLKIHSPQPDHARAHATILFVEDHPYVRRGTVKILERMGYAVLTAEDAVEALKVWEAEGHHIDLLFTDMMMPNYISGLELGKRLRQHKAGLKILLTSGYSEEALPLQTLREEDIHFLAKPYDFQTLSEALKESLEKT